MRQRQARQEEASLAAVDDPSSEGIGPAHRHLPEIERRCKDEIGLDPPEGDLGQREESGEGGILRSFCCPSPWANLPSVHKASFFGDLGQSHHYGFDHTRSFGIAQPSILMCTKRAQTQSEPASRRGCRDTPEVPQPPETGNT